jgi:hypothetical protein
MNLDIDATRIKRRIQISELEELRLKAYHNASIYKERMKRWYDKSIRWNSRKDTRYYYTILDTRSSAK